jgi:glycosyltransferase involved in cell wall biosynthesis
MTALPQITIIIPTRANRDRADLLRRAVGSVLTQAGVAPTALLVANGPDRDPGLIRELAADPRCVVIQRAEPGIPEAIRIGRYAVRTEWFGELDDDDYLLPGALERRLRLADSRPDCDVIVTNGLVSERGQQTLRVPDFSAIREDPAVALTRGNWLLPGAWLCRTAEVKPELFDRIPAWLEVTYFALCFSLEHQIAFLDEPTVVWFLDTPGSASKSRACAFGQVPALKELLALPLPRRVRRGFRAHLARASHDLADRYYHEGAWTLAWRWHCRSLLLPGGWRFLPFFRRLLLSPRAGRT